MQTKGSRPGTAPHKRGETADTKLSSSEQLLTRASSSGPKAVSWSSGTLQNAPPSETYRDLQENARGQHPDVSLPFISSRSGQRPKTSSGAFPSSRSLGQTPSASTGAHDEEDSEPSSKFSGVASKLRKQREATSSHLVEKLRGLTEHTKKDLKKAELRLRGAADENSSLSAGESKGQSSRIAGFSSLRDITHLSSHPQVTLLSVGSESFINEGNSRRGDDKASYEDIGDEDIIHRSQVDTFIGMSRKKAVLFNDPSRHEEMQRTRSFKDNSIVSSLKGAAPGFLSREDRLFDFDGKDLDKGLFNHEKEVISGLYKPRTYAFLHGKAASSAIEVVPSPFLAPSDSHNRKQLFARGSVWQSEGQRLLRAEREAEDIDFDWDDTETDRRSGKAFGKYPKSEQNFDDRSAFKRDRFGSESASAIFGTSTDLGIPSDGARAGEEDTPLDQSDDEYDGTIKMENYFGPEARVKFFNLYKKLAQQRQLEEVDDNNVMDASSSGFQMNSTNQPLPQWTTESGRPMSPRRKFLTMIVMRARHPPIPIIIRNTIDDHLNLSHKSLGDDYIIYLSAVISELPNVLKVSLRDNRLTDRGLGRFIDMLCRQDKIIEVDLSENKLDSRSAEALAGYLVTPYCSLSTLRLSQADLDDNETSRFLDALGNNTSITSIDLSHNVIGASADSDRNDYQAIGSVIAKALISNQTLRFLDLSHNKLTPPAAFKIGGALEYNKFLVELNLSNNGIKDKGAEAIGAALMANMTLQRIDLSYNGIGAIGATAIAVGLRLDEHIEHVNLTGNPIGFTGGRSIVNSLNYHSCPRRVLLFNCSFEESMNSAQTVGFDPTNPAGEYCLDLGNTISRCIVYELLYLATVRRGCGFRNMKHISYSSDKSKRRQPLKTTLISFRRADNPAMWIGEPYGPWSGDQPRPPDPLTKMVAADWMYRIRRLALLDSLTGKMWIPPSDGELRFEFYCQPRCPCPIECLNESGLSRYKEMLQKHPKERANILKIAGSLMLESHQAREILKYLEPKLRVEGLANLLPAIRDTSNVIPLLNDFVPDLDSLRSIQRRLKQLYFVCINSFSGYYSLDINDTIDRMTALRLMEISAHEHAVAKRLNPLWCPETHGHASQYLNRTNFRNVVYGRVPMASGISDSFFAKGLKDKTAGLLQFDFVSISQPTENVRSPSISRELVEELLIQRGFYTFGDQTSSSSSAELDDIRRYSAVGSAISSDFSSKSNVAVRKAPADDVGKVVAAASRSSGPTHRLVSRRHSATNISKILKIPCSVPLLGGLNFEEGSIMVGAFITDASDVLDFVNRNNSTSANVMLGKMTLDDGRAIKMDFEKNIALYRSDGRGHVDRVVLNLEVRILNDLKTQLLEPLGIFIRSEGKRYNPYGVDSLDRGKGPSLAELMGLDKDNPYFEIGLEPVPDLSKLSPMFKKYHIGDDITICGSSIFVHLYTSEWNPESIYQKCRDLILKLFSLLTITDSCVRIVSHKSTESRMQSECLAARFKCDNVNHITVLHQIDVIVDGIALTDRAIIKSSTEVQGQAGQKTDYLCCFWRWRPRLPFDRGSSSTDMLFSTSAHDVWGNKLFILRSVISDKWITCEQASSLAIEFPTFGSDGQPYRESAIINMFSRLVDSENFQTILDSSLIPDCHHSAYKRIGFLNTLNGFQLDRHFVLELDSPECRLLAFILTKLAGAEPGQNTIDQRYCRSNADLFSYGWSIPADWGTETERGASDAIPTKGKLILRYSSQPERGCRLIPELRAAIQQKYLLLGVPRKTDGQDVYRLDTREEDWEDSFV